MCFSYVLGSHKQCSRISGSAHGLHTAIVLSIQRLVASGDSKLVVNQVMKALACRDSKMEAYRGRKLKAKFDAMELRHISSEEKTRKSTALQG